MYPSENPKTSLSAIQIFWRFLRYGFLAWGGPIAQIDLMRYDLVEKEKWLSSAAFNRVLGVYQALPGPEATELAVYFGILKAGRLGGVLAGLAFIIPGAILMVLLSALYVKFGALPFSMAFFAGCQAAIMALIIKSLVRMGRRAIHGARLWLACITVIALQLLGIHFAISLLAAGLLAVGVKKTNVPVGLFLTTTVIAAGWIFGTAPSLGIQGLSAFAAVPQAVNPSQIQLLFSGLKAGLLTFGGAYTVLPFLAQDTVGQGWLSSGAFLDGVALSGIIPAPFIIFATFIGYLLKGILGAFTMTVGIFFPAFAITLVGHKYLEKAVQYDGIHTFLDGVTAGVMGLLVVTIASLMPQALGSPQNLLLAALAMIVLILWPSKAAIPFSILGAGFLRILLA